MAKTNGATDVETLPPSPSIPNKDEDDVPAPPPEDEVGETTVVQDSGETSEGGKLKMIVQLLKRCLGVKDLAAMYVSLLAPQCFGGTDCGLSSLGFFIDFDPF